MSAKVIIVEPSRSISQLLATFCARHGVEVEIHAGMHTALSSAQASGKVAAITISHQLEDGDGIALIYSLRALSYLATTPIIFLTGDSNVETARTALEAGATEVYQKSEIDAIEYALNAAIAEKMLAPVFAGRALVVEDTQSIVALLKQICEQFGLEVDAVDSAEEGFRIFQENTYQLAVIDIILAGLHSGIDLVRRIRRLPDSRSRLPILVTSSYNDTARRIELLRSGADDFVSKPLIDEEIAWRMLRLLQRTHWDPVELSREAANDALQRTLRLHYLLSSREAEIATAIVQGLSDKKIAAELGISFWTVRTHINHIFAKTNSFNRTHLVARVSALRDGDHSPPSA